MHVVGLVLFVAAFPAAVAGGNKTLGSWSIPKCDFSTMVRSPSTDIPKVACDRDDLHRVNLCSLLAKLPPRIPDAAMASARLHSDRRSAVDAHMPPSARKGGRLVEVGTMTGAFAKFLVRSFQPAELVVMDVDGWAINQCKGRTSQVAAQISSNITVKCYKGDSKKRLLTLEDNAYDFIYIDGAHDYKGACGDAEAARTKVKVGGIMAFNDYYRFEYGFLARKGRWGSYGVPHTVNEFVVRYAGDWEVAYYTLPGDNGGGDGGDFGLRRVR